MAVRTGKVIMAQKIRMDRGYKNVISYDEDEIVTLLTNNAVAVFNNCSFTRPGENVITVGMSYGNAIKCNYVGFQNPDYSNKWFFAFIDEIEYIADDTVNVHYTIDEFSTWYSYWSPEPCFVEREHANSDVAGDNLVPEQLELGDYTANGALTEVGFGTISPTSVSTSLYYIVLSNYSPRNETYLGTNICGVPVAGGLYMFDSWQAMLNGIQQYSDNQHMDQISQVYAVPSDLASSMIADSTYKTWGQGTDEDSYYQYNGSKKAYTLTKTLSAPTTIGSYTPVNQKLLTAPYVCCVLANTSGSSNPLCYEYFTNRTVSITCYGTPSIGCSIINYPTNYKGQSINYSEGIACGKFPTLSWSGDAFTNWLTQNSVNLALGVGGDLINIAVGGALLATGNPLGLGNLAGGTVGTAGQLHEIYQHSVTPQTSEGLVNCGDVVTSSNVNGCYLQPMSIREAQAERIDKYFTRYGYRTNKTKVANQFGRTNWNYVKIAQGEDIGIPSPVGPYSVISIPPNSMEAINNIFRSGVTIWHNHANLGNFALDNPIGS